MAVNCVTAMDCRVAAVTASVVEPVTPFSAALMVAVPTATPVPSPFDPAALETVAMVAADEVQVAWLVRFWVLPSEKVPMAVNCCVVPLAIEGAAGVTAIDWSVTAVTVTVVEPATLPLVAVTVADPGATAVISPVLETVTTPASEEVQAAEGVRSCVDWSEYVPVAVSWSVVPAPSEGLDGVIPIDWSVFVLEPEPEHAESSSVVDRARHRTSEPGIEGRRERTVSTGRTSSPDGASIVGSVQDRAGPRGRRAPRHSGRAAPGCCPLSGPVVIDARPRAAGQRSPAGGLSPSARGCPPPR